jgi:hypothetical protein
MESPCAMLPKQAILSQISKGAEQMGSTHGLRVFGLSLLAALSLMAVGAMPATAETGKVLILDRFQATTSELYALFDIEIDLLARLDVPSMFIEIDCPKLTIPETLILPGGVIHIPKILYSECQMWGTNPSLVLLSECEIYPTLEDREAKTNKGHITVEALFSVLLHTGEDGSKTLVVVKPKEAGGPLTRPFLKNCPAAAPVIKGEVDLLFHTSGHRVEHLVEEATGSFKLHQLKFINQNANLLGSVWVGLIAEHTGQAWAIV